MKKYEIVSGKEFSQEAKKYDYMKILIKTVYTNIAANNPIQQWSDVQLRVKIEEVIQIHRAYDINEGKGKSSLNMMGDGETGTSDSSSEVWGYDYTSWDAVDLVKHCSEGNWGLMEDGTIVNQQSLLMIMNSAKAKGKAGKGRRKSRKRRKRR